jgi:hypothetical protein
VRHDRGVHTWQSLTVTAVYSLGFRQRVSSFRLGFPYEQNALFFFQFIYTPTPQVEGRGSHRNGLCFNYLKDTLIN